MQTVLNTILDRARQSAQAGAAKFNPYPAGTLRAVAYEIGYDEHDTAVVVTRDDGQVFAVQEVEPGLYQSVLPEDLAAESALHADLEDAVAYVRELAVRAGVTAQAIAA